MLRVIVSALLVFILARTFYVQGLVLPLRVLGESMTPTLESGERIVMDRTAFWFRSPRRWEVVVLRMPNDPRQLCVKRVVGLPGETIEIREGQILADGRPLTDVPASLQVMPYPGQLSGQSPEYRLSVDEYFVLGDNGDVSEDSRIWQPPQVPIGSIVGKPIGE